MPNVISKDKRRLTYLEHREVAEWLENLSKETGIVVAELIRQATAAYYHKHSARDSELLIDQRTAAKEREREKDRLKLRSNTVNRKSQNSLIPPSAKVTIVDFWGPIQRRYRNK